MSFDTCTKCRKGVMLHPKVYVFTCSYCGFSYRIDPAGRIPSITILNRGKKS